MSDLVRCAKNTLVLYGV
jgi:hypothetical protein